MQKNYYIHQLFKRACAVLVLVAHHDTLNGIPRALKITDDKNNILVAGDLAKKLCIAKFNANGDFVSIKKINSGNTPEVSYTTEQIDFDSDNKLVVVAKNGNNYIITRYNEDGTPDTTFTTSSLTKNSQLRYYAKSLVFQQDKKILVGIRISNGQLSEEYSEIRRFNANGTLDTTFGTQGVKNLANVSINSITVAENNSIVVTGFTKELNTQKYSTVCVRYDTNGNDDINFNNNIKQFLTTNNIDSILAITAVRNEIILATNDTRGYQINNIKNDGTLKKQIAAEGVRDPKSFDITEMFLLQPRLLYISGTFGEAVYYFSDSSNEVRFSDYSKPIKDIIAVPFAHTGINGYEILFADKKNSSMFTLTYRALDYEKNEKNLKDIFTATVDEQGNATKNGKNFAAIPAPVTPTTNIGLAGALNDLATKLDDLAQILLKK